MAATGDRRLVVEIRKVGYSGWQMRQTWAKDPKARQWRNLPEGTQKWEVEDKMDKLGYRVEVVR